MEYQAKLKELGITVNKTDYQTCPQCSASRKKKTDKCLSVKFDTNAILYNCHHCDWSGSVFYRDKIANKKYKKPEIPKNLTDKEKVYKYFEGRGISKKTVDLHKIEYNGKEIIFPYYKDGELLNIKYRDGQKEFRQEPNTQKTFFGMDLIKDFSYVVITEGEFDSISLIEIGLPAISVPGGANDNLECIDNCWEWLQKFETFIIAVDNDEPGDKLKTNLLNRLDKYKCKTVNFQRWKDANEVLTSPEGGRDKLMEFINNAEVINSDNIIDNYAIWDKMCEFYMQGYTRGFSTGWTDLNDIFTVKTGYLMVVTGYPSRGKSYFTDNLLMNLSENYGWKHLIASFESTEDIHFADLCTMKQGKLFNKSVKWEDQEIGNALSFVMEHFYRLKTDRLWNIDEICKEAEYAVKRYGIKTLVIDPYNRLNHPTSDREDKYIGSILAKLIMLAKKLDILVIFIAHPKKPDSDTKPNMYSISGSPDWYNMADIGIIVHRKRLDGGKLENKCFIDVQKVKNKHVGDPQGGEITLFLNFKTWRLEKYR